MLENFALIIEKIYWKNCTFYFVTDPNKSDYYDVDVTGIDGKKKLLPREVLAITSNQAKKSAEVVVR